MKIHTGDTPWCPREAAEFEDWHMWNHPLEGVVTDHDGTRYYFTVLRDDQNNDDGHVSTWMYLEVTPEEETSLLNTLPWPELEQFHGRMALIATAVDLRITSCEYREFTKEDYGDPLP